MSTEKIKELLDLMKEHELVELELEEEEFKLRLKKASGPDMTFVPSALPAQAAAMSAPAASAGAAPAAAAAPAEDLTPIPSPIVGTFYRAPAPEADPFVSEGDTVNSENVVCIVEAMKIMNEVKAGVKGVIKEILVENGEPVEYGQPLFLVKT